MLDRVVGLAALDDQLLVVAHVALQPHHPLPFPRRFALELVLLLVALLVLLVEGVLPLAQDAAPVDLLLPPLQHVQRGDQRARRHPQGCLPVEHGRRRRCEMVTSGVVQADKLADAFPVAAGAELARALLR